jgi:hypothetical protein
MSKDYYREAGPQTTTSATYTPMTSVTGDPLEFTHPPSSGSVLVILSVPNAVAVGRDFPGISFGLMVNGVMSRMVANFTSEARDPGVTGATSTTLVLQVGGGPSALNIQAVWKTLGTGARAILDTYASLTGIIVNA